MHSVVPSLTALRTALPTRLRTAADECAVLPDDAPEAVPSARPAARGLDRFDPGTYPPFETIDVGPTRDDAPTHGVVVWNDGPKRTLSLSAESAGRGVAVTDARLVDADGVIRLALHRPDRYEVTIAAPGRPRHAVAIDPAWFDRDARATNVRVQSDGYVRYEPV
jgi:hypothetical protein